MGSLVRPPSYRALLSAPGRLDFVIPGGIGRLPGAMRSIACILLIQEYTGSFGLAGTIGAVQTVISAVAGPRLGRLADRRSHRLVLALTMLGQAISSLALIVLAADSAPAWPMLAMAVLLGATAMPFPSMSRALWSARVARGPILERAFTLESILDQIAYTIGPFVAILLSVQLTPGAGMLGAFAMTAVASLGFMRMHDIRIEQAADHTTQAAIRIRGLQILVLAFIGMGMLYGANEVGLIAFADEQGHPGVASLLVSFFAFGSFFGALFYGARTWRASIVRRTTTGITWVWLTMLQIIFAPNLWWCGVAILICGVAISPAEISAFTLTEQIIPKTARTEGFSWIIAGISLGAALGAMFGGMAIDAAGSRLGLTVSFIGGAIAVASLVFGARVLGRATPAREPAAAD